MGAAMAILLIGLLGLVVLAGQALLLLARGGLRLARGPAI
jgi:hypothetical protein